MMLLQRRILRELIVNTSVCALLLMSIFMLLGTAKLLAEVEGIGLGLFLTSLPVVLTARVDLYVPLSVLVGVVMTYGRLAADNEIEAVRASGINPWHLITPGLVFGMAITASMVWMMDYGQPLAAREIRRLVSGDDMAQALANKLGSGESVYVGDDLLVSGESIDENGYARNLTIQRLDEEGQVTQATLAEKARIYIDLDRAELVLVLIQFRVTIGGALSGENTEIRIPLGRSLVELHMADHTTPQLMSWIAKDPSRRGIFSNPLRVRQAVASRLSTAASCIVFVLLGVPVALRFRRSDRLGAFLVAFLLALFLYYPSVRITKALSVKNVVPPEIAAWSGDGLLLVVGVVLSRRMFQR